MNAPDESRAGMSRLAKIEEASSKQAYKGDEWENDAPGALDEADVDLMLYEKCSEAGKDGQGNSDQPADARNAMCALVHSTFCFNGHVVRAVDQQCSKC